MAVTSAPSDFSNPRSADTWNQRMLAAIVLTDGVGFSKRMAEDEELTLKIVSRDLTTMSSLCQQYAGQVIKSTGDGLLMMFPSAVNAVHCVLAIQRQMADQAATLPPAETMQHRVGMHLGEVFYDGNDIMGNAVNIAARLEPKSPHGGLCLSQAVYDLVRDKLEVEVSSLGEQLLKNIRDPMMVYQITLEQLLASEFATVVVPSQTSIRFGSAQRKGRSSASSQAERDRQVILSKVRNFWVQGVLENSLHGRALLELGLEERPDAVQNPWGLAWETAEQTRQPLRPGTTATEMFDKLGTGATLLILGAPGSGKTTTLLQLTRDLLNRADHDPNHAIPIVLNLSSWILGQSVANWLVEDLHLRYQVPKVIGKRWIEQQTLTLMLDGLDEVAVSRQTAFVDAINQFSQTYGHTEIVVCSRIKDYDALSSRLQFQGAIFIQPLANDQVQTYLAQAGDELAGLQEVLPLDRQLQELVTSPLMLSIMTIAYRGMSTTELLHLTLTEDQIQPLFAAYADRMFQRQGKHQPYTQKQATEWLRWLSLRMFLNSQTIFAIEQMQPTLFQYWWQLWIYRFGVGLSLGTVYGLLFGFMYRSVIAAPIVSIIALPTVSNLFSEELFWQNTFFQYLAQALLSLQFAPLLGVSLALLGTLPAALLGGLDEIRPIETLRWSWRRLGWLGGAIPLGLLIVLQGKGIGFILSLSLSLVFSFGLVSANVEDKTVPNEGIWRSAANASYLLLLAELSVVLQIWWFFDHQNLLFPELGFGFSVGLVFILRSKPVSAGVALVQHLVLRTILWLSGATPRNYGRFLNYATRCILMQRVGSSYVFIHRLLLEHFARVTIDRDLQQL